MKRISFAVCFMLFVLFFAVSASMSSAAVLTVTQPERAAIHARVDAISGDIGNNNWGTGVFYDPNRFIPRTLIGEVAYFGRMDRVSRSTTVTPTYPFRFTDTTANMNELSRKIAMFEYAKVLSNALGFPVVVHRQDQNYVFVEFGDPDAPEMIMGYSHLDGTTGSVSAAQVARWRGPDGQLGAASSYYPEHWHTTYIRDGWIYAQGVNDGMGPMMAMYFAAKALMDAANAGGITFDRRIRVVLGGYEEGGGATPSVANTQSFVNVPHYTANPSFYDNWAYKILNREEMPVAAMCTDSRFPTVIGNAQQITRIVSMDLSSDIVSGKPFSLIAGTFGVTDRIGDPVLGDIVYGSVAQVASKAVFTIDKQLALPSSADRFVDDVKAAATARGWSTVNTLTELAKVDVRTSGDVIILTVNTDLTMESPSPHYANNAIVWGMHLISDALGKAKITSSDLQLKKAADGITDLFFRGGVEDYLGRHMGISGDLVFNPHSATPNMTFAFGRLSTASANFYSPISGDLYVGMFIMNMFDNAAQYNIARDLVTNAWQSRGFVIDGATTAWSAQSMYMAHNNPIATLLPASYRATIAQGNAINPGSFAGPANWADVAAPQGTTGGTYAGPFFNKMSTFGGIMPGYERWWHTANERIGTLEIVQMTKLMADGLLEMARYSGPAGAKFMSADIRGLDSSRADLDMLDVQLNTYKDASRFVTPTLLGAQNVLFGATSFDIPMFRERVTSSQSITAINAGHATNGIYLPTASIPAGTTYVLPMRLEFKVKKPASLTDARWNSIIASDMNTFARAMSFNVINGTTVHKLTIPQLDNPGMYISKRVSQYDPNTLYVSVNIALKDDSFTGIEIVSADSRTDLFEIHPDYLAANPNPFPERGAKEKRGFFVFGGTAKNARFTSPTIFAAYSVGVTNITLNSNDVSLNRGASGQLIATVTPADATDRFVIWSSNSPTVVSVDQTGRITGVGLGTATITATTRDGGFTATCTVAVRQPVTGVTVLPTTLSMNVGDPGQLIIATVEPFNAYNTNVTWSSSNNAVASVDRVGFVTPRAAGSADITVRTVDGGFTATCRVTVSTPPPPPVPVTSVSLNRSTLTLRVGSSDTLVATVLPANADDRSVRWNSSNTNVATVSATGVVNAIGSGSTLITVTTNDGGYTATCAVTVPVSVSGVTVNPTTLAMVVGDTPYILYATVSPAGANQNVTWTSSNAAAATVDANGFVTPVAAGTTDITVRTVEGGFTATCRVTVTAPPPPPIPVQSVSLNRTALSLRVGSSDTLVATVLPVSADNRLVDWNSSSTSVATVNSSGVVTAVGPGNTTITVTTRDGGFTATCAVEVIANVTGVQVTPSTLTLNVGDPAYLLLAAVSPPAANQNVTWSSSNAGVATVNAQGLVTVVAPGSTTITATTAEGNFTSTCVVTVPQPPVYVTGVTLNRSTLTLRVGSSDTLVATVVPASADNRLVDWNSSSPNVATVNSTGVVTAVGPGNTTITVTTRDGGFTATCVVDVPVNVTGVQVSPSTLTLNVGDPAYLLSVTVTPIGANQSVTWTSSNVAVATVNAQGSVTVVGPGSTTITATTAEGNFTSTCVVTVPQPPILVNGVTLDQNTLSLVVGTTGTLVATVTPASADNRAVTWLSSSPTVATVANGVVTALTVGATTITVRTTDGGFEDYCAVVVTAAHVPVTGVLASPTSMNLVAGNSDLLSAIVQPTTATNQSVTFTSSSNAVATVNTSGLVVAVAAGTATITIVTAEGAFSADCTVVVTRAPILVTGVTLTPASAEIVAGSTRQLNASVIPASADNRNVAFTSSNNAIATVSATGLVTAVAEGRAVITVETAEGGFKASSDITVTPMLPVKIDVTGVEVTPTSATIEIGKTVTLTEKVLPDDATIKTVKWESSNNNIATVNATGVVTGVSEGTATITVRTDDMNRVATSTITVVAGIVPADPTYPPTKAGVSDISGIPAGDLVERNNKVYLTDSLMAKIAKNLLDVDAVDTHGLPIFTVEVTPDGQIAQVTITVTGKDLLVKSPSAVELIGMISDTEGKLFNYVSDLADFADMTFTIMYKGDIFDGTLISNEEYQIVVFIKDGGIFDLDGAVNGDVLAAIFVAAEKEGGSGGGCNTYGYLAFALLAIAPFVLRRSK